MSGGGGRWGWGEERASPGDRDCCPRCSVPLLTLLMSQVFIIQHANKVQNQEIWGSGPHRVVQGDTKGGEHLLMFLILTDAHLC